MKNKVALLLSLSLLCVAGSQATRSHRKNNNKNNIQHLPAAISMEEFVAEKSESDVFAEDTAACDVVSTCAERPQEIDSTQPGLLSWLGEIASDSWFGTHTNLLHEIESEKLVKTERLRYRLADAITITSQTVFTQEKEANRLKNRVMGIHNPELKNLITLLETARNKNLMPESAITIGEDLNKLHIQEEALLDSLIVESMRRLYLIKKAHALATLPLEENESTDSEIKSYETIRGQVKRLGKRFGKTKVDHHIDQLDSLTA